MKCRDKQYKLINLIKKVLINQEKLEIKTLKNLNNMIGCLELYCTNKELALSECLKAFRLKSTTYKRYVIKLNQNSDFIVKKRGPRIIVTKHNWTRINAYVKRSIINSKQYWYVNKLTLWERVKNKFDIPKLSYSAFNKKVDLKKYKKRKRITLVHKVWEIATPGYVQIDGINLNNPGFAFKESKHHIYTAIDCYSRVSFAYCYDEKCRSNSVDFVNKAINYFNKYGISINHIRTDNGAEYVYTRSRKHNEREHRILSDFEINLFYKGINHDTTMPGFPNQNGKVERFNRSIIQEHISYMYDNYSKLKVDEINKYLELYLRYYNERRTHSTLKTTPKEVIQNYVKWGVVSDHVFNNEVTYSYN